MPMMWPRAVLWVLLILAAGCQTSGTEEVRLYAAPRTDRTPFLAPIFLFVGRYTGHLLVHLKGHPQTASAEVMFNRLPDGGLRGRAILTDHAGATRHFISDPKRLVRIAKEEGLDQLAVGSITASTDGARGEVRTGFQAKDLALDMVAFLDGPKVKGLANPEERGRGQFLPMVMRGLSSLGSKRSTVTLDGKTWPIPVKISTPFFTLYSAFWTRDLRLGVIRSGHATLTLCRGPHPLVRGAFWEYETTDGPLRWTVSAVTAEAVTVTRNHMTVQARLQGARLEIESVEARSTTAGARTTRVRVCFEPPLPDLPCLAADARRRGSFRVMFDDKEKVLQGRYEVSRKGGSVRIQMTPTSPSWACSRAFVSTLRVQGDRVSLACRFDEKTDE
jgi:hypothetical protein